MNPDVSILIVSYNVCSFLQNCLLSLQQSAGGISYEVIVVDNASGDNSQSIIPAQFPHVRWIQNTENRGFAAANNQAILTARGRYLWLLNPDTEVSPSSLEHLLEFMESNPSAGASGSKLLNPDGSLQLSCYPFPTLAREFVRLFHLECIFPNSQYPLEKWDETGVYAVDNLQGASLLLRKTALDQIGLLDEAFFMYTEEMDLNFRLKKGGWGNFWVPASQLIHFGGQSTRQNQTAMFLELYKSKILFFRKHHGRLSAFLYKLLLILASLARIIAGKITNLFRRASNTQSILVNYQYLLKCIGDF